MAPYKKIESALIHGGIDGDSYTGFIFAGQLWFGIRVSPKFREIIQVQKLSHYKILICILYHRIICFVKI